MSDLVMRTVVDLHCGRMSWRVALLLAIPALSVGVIVGLFS